MDYKVLSWLDQHEVGQRNVETNAGSYFNQCNECNINSHSAHKGTNSIPSDREGQSVQWIIKALVWVKLLIITRIGNR